MAESTATPGTSAAALTFTFSTQALRAVMIDGEPWFVASDVCDALDHSDTSKAVSRLDDDEKLTRTMFASGQNREMLVINESGLYSLILTSRKPEAKRFKKWVTSEVLPAIRKTGRYEAPSAPAPQAPTEATEALSLRDLEAVKRVVWFIGHHFRFTEVWTQGVWHYLRLALGNPAPRPFAVVQMPHIAHELACIAASANAVHELLAHIEREAARRILRKGEATDVVLADLRRKADAQLALLAAGPQPAVPLWLQHDIAALTNRTQRVVMDHPECNEQPDFFKPAAQPSTATV